MLAAELASLIIAATLPLSGGAAPSQPLLWGKISSFALPPGMSGVAIDVFRVEGRAKVYWTLKRTEFNYGMGSASITWIDTRTCSVALDVLKSTQDLKNASGYTGPPVIDGVTYSIKTRASFPAASGSAAINSQGNWGSQTEAWFEKQVPRLESCWHKEQPNDIALPEPVDQAATPSS